MTFEIGHTHSQGSNGKPWQTAIRQALKERESGDDPKALRKLATKLLNACDKGDIAALKELGDRLDGKSTEHRIVENLTPFDRMSVDELLVFSRTLSRLVETGAVERLNGTVPPEAGALPALPQAETISQCGK